MTEQETAAITNWHAHVYYDEASRAHAAWMRERASALFDVVLGRWREEPVGPHPQAMYQVAFAPGQFAALVLWIALNRGGLVVLVHPDTGDSPADHSDHAIWLGAKLELDIEFLRNFDSA